ncbi:MAG TPA: MFS transporter [Dehalococcoidia bacterium]|nr:MFS transporter [Dehalococcoidia bacterium]
MTVPAGSSIDWTERRTILGREILVWQANLYALLIVVFVAFVGFSFASPFIPILVRDVGVADPAGAAIWSGIILATGPIGAVLTGPFWGRVADKVGGRITLSRTVFGFGVLTAVMAFSTDVWQLALLRFGMGSLGGFTTVAAAMASMSSPPDRTTRSIALIQSAQIVSLMVGPALGGIMADHLGIRAAFLGSAGLAAFAFVTMLILYRDPVGFRKQHQRGAGAGPQPGFWSILKTPFFLPLLLVLFAGNFTDRSFQPLVPLFVPTLGDVSIQSVASTSGFIVAAGALAAVVSANAAGRLVQRFTHAQLLFFSQILAAVGCALIAVCQSAWQFGLLRAEVGLFGGGVLTLAYGLGGALIPIERRASAFGVLATGAMVGAALSPLAAGLIAAFDLRAAFLLNAAIFLIGAAIVWLGLGFGPIRTAETAGGAGP